MDSLLLANNGIEALPLFLTSLSIGLLIGLERERNPSAKAGLRTFALVAVFGTLVAMLGSKSGSTWLLGAGMLAIAAMIISVYINRPTENNDPGTTTVAALLLCYVLTAVAKGLGKPTIFLAVCAVISAALVMSRCEVALSRHVLTFCLAAIAGRKGDRFLPIAAAGHATPNTAGRQPRMYCLSQGDHLHPPDGPVPASASVGYRITQCQ